MSVMYKINIMTGNDFDSLPTTATRGSDISNSLGFANKFTGNAYVRDTGIKELNQYLINHELEELEAEHSTHEDGNGIRHKLFGGGGGGGQPSGPDPAQQAAQQAAAQQAAAQAQFDAQQQAQAQQFTDFTLGRRETLGAARASSPTLGAAAQAGGFGGSPAIGGLAGGLANLSPQVLERLKGSFAGQTPRLPAGLAF